MVEHGLLGPNSMYDACGLSFIAANGDHVKASTHMFEDTGVMAMLCHHDVPLFLVNMWTPGEKQFYAFALIAALLQHIPTLWRVRVLYDIGCQMDRALKKWDFAPSWQSHLAWGVLIFHAYGHQYNCQLWYHPQKSAMWGFTDGEGCERFWSEL